MTREEAMAVLEGLSDNPLFSNQHKAAFNIAIHDIKQRHDWDINNLILVNKDDYESLGQEPRKGHWIRVDKDKLRCPKCDVIHFIAQYPEGKIEWCPNCGARMESNLEKRKPCINYSDGCEEWAGCPCVYYKAAIEAEGK